MSRFLQLASWTGALLIVGAFFLNTFGVISPSDKIYPLMNLVGAIFLGDELWRKQAYSGLAVQAVWFCIAAYNLLLLFFR